MGLFVMGVGAIYILIKRTNISVQLNEILLSLIVTLLTFVLLLLLDKWMDFAIFNEYVKFGVEILYRAILLLAVFLFYWKPKSLWAKELLCRIEI